MTPHERLLKVLLVTTWGVPCGISEHSAYLKAAIEAADPDLPIDVEPNLHPTAVSNRLGYQPTRPDLVILNYHAALHSQWHPEHLQALRAGGVPVLVTYHDSGVPNTDQAKGICTAASAFVVHEPYEDLEGNGRYWRQGVPGWAEPWEYDQGLTSWCGPRPIVGTVGFPFPWKNYDLLCEASALAGWATLLIAPGATREQIDRWLGLNPYTWVIPEFIDRGRVAASLAGCDATAFLYSCQNAGTSGAIRQGIAARKPLLALAACRQFRELWEEPSPTGPKHEPAITWLHDGSPQAVANALSWVPIQRVSAPMVELAERDSWARLGAKYSGLIKELIYG